MNRGRARRWTELALGLVLLAAVVAALHHAGSFAGDVVTRNRARGFEADAYFYTEVGEVRAFLDDGGRYRAARRDNSPVGEVR